MHVICGAGCAGLSLACALLDAGVREPIVLLDPRTSFDQDRTWCFWATGDVPFAHLATHRWPAWRTVDRTGRAHTQRSPAHPYLHLPADRFYAAALDRLAHAPNVELRLGVRVLGLDDHGDGVRVRTTGGAVEARIAYDAMGGSGPLNVRRPPGTVELRQRFLGLEVELEHPVLDPSVATLMDLRDGRPGDDGLHFTYLLPFGRTRALVEHTTLGGASLPASARRAAIAAHLGALGAGELRVLREERGALAMTTHAFPTRRSPRLLAVGAAAGALRPSSGYAFVRLQRHVRAVACAVHAGQPAPARLGRRRHRALDRLFLRAMDRDPASFDVHLVALARRVDGGAFARFMTDASTLRDEAAIAAALASPGFLAAVALGAPRPSRAAAAARVAAT